MKKYYEDPKIFYETASMVARIGGRWTRCTTVDSHLDDTAHEAGVPQVDEAPQAQAGVLRELPPPGIELEQVNLLLSLP